MRERDSDGFTVQANVLQSEDFVSNARPELPTFCQPPMAITPEQWETAFNSSLKRFCSAFVRRIGSCQMVVE